MKICPNCGEEVQDVDVIFHRCSDMRENSKDSVVPFLIAGIVGSSIPMLNVYMNALVNFGAVGLLPFFHLIVVLMGSWAGYGLFCLIKSPSNLTMGAMIVLSAILGYVFSSLFLFFLY